MSINPSFRCHTFACSLLKALVPATAALAMTISPKAISGTASQARDFADIGLKPMTDEAMSRVSGQALFVSDFIPASGNGDGSDPTDFSFHRMGLDVDLALNANIDKLQLGCGGFNDAIAPNACDIDMDYVRFMGRNGSNPGSPVTSDFVLTRPYIEIAVRDDGNPDLREVVGIKIGAEQADGFMSVGRDYFNASGNPSGRPNLENGGTCNATEGSGALACHSGINRISGAITAELSGALDVSVFGSTSSTCFGQTNLGNGQCSGNAPFFATITGSRLNSINVPLIELSIDGGLAGLLSGTGYANVIANTRFIHGFALENTSDFFLSFQRERVAYPNFDATGYSENANAGWWLNVPSVKVVDLQAPSQSLGLFEALGALAPPGIAFQDLEFGQRPTSNCYGGQMFC